MESWFILLMLPYSKFPFHGCQYFCQASLIIENNFTVLCWFHKFLDKIVAQYCKTVCVTGHVFENEM